MVLYTGLGITGVDSVRRLGQESSWPGGCLHLSDAVTPAFGRWGQEDLFEAIKSKDRESGSGVQRLSLTGSALLAIFPQSCCLLLETPWLASSAPIHAAQTLTGNFIGRQELLESINGLNTSVPWTPEATGRNLHGRVAAAV